MNLLHKRLAILAFPAFLLAVANFAQAAEATGTKMGETKEWIGEKAEKTGEYMSDSVITAKIKGDILADPSLKVFQIHVTTTDGVVVLSGEVDSQQSIDRAKEIAHSVKHVKSVESELAVKPAP
jgi:hyperosmotically inducible protein